MKKFVIALAALTFAATAQAASARETTKPVATVPPASEAAIAKAKQHSRRTAIGQVQSWGIQLRLLDKAAMAASPFDLIVIDQAPHRTRGVEIPYSRSDIEPLKVKPDGTRRLVMSYLSMGEAERYRTYWQPAWDVAETRPNWLGPENPKWAGNYQVQYADPNWQTIIFGSPTSLLDRIIAAGFDGVYLDRVDAYQDVEETAPGAEDAMRGYLQRLTDHARRLNPDFLIIMQNAEELSKSKPLLERLDAISKEDLLYGFDNSEMPNPKTMVVESLTNLRKAKRAGVKIFVLEYSRGADAVEATKKLTQREGFLLHITDRMLGVLSPESRQPGTSAGDPPAVVRP